MAASAAIPAAIDFPQEEEKVIKLWKELDAFQTSLKRSKGRPKFTFYDGPPFATGLPHYGHVLTGTIKDIVTRWMHQHGYHVERRFGWDTHGLPVEYEIDKMLNIKGPEDVEKMGIAAYNAECRKIVTRYCKEWEVIMTRLGRWIDFEKDYKTLYPWYMESIWWVFKQLWDKGFIYKGFRVMPYSTACATPLSNFEASQAYKEVNDPAITVSFPMDENPDVSFLAWTTTPWTLPSNLALCVNPEMAYAKVKDVASGKLYILMEKRLPHVFKKEEDYEILQKFKGEVLENKGYKPIFDYFIRRKEAGAFRVLCDSYVTDDSGTGIVQQAPYFGEDDNRVCKSYGIIKDGEQDVVCPLDSVGRFVDPVKDFSGMYVKDADKHIVKSIKDAGRMFHLTQLKHSYPFCWRSDTPLLYRAVPSWFMRVQHMRKELETRNNETYWVPDSIREGRFANWLRDARDWNLSRNRYWGTPMPVWISEDGEESVCIGSISELEKLSGVRVEDLHREFVDQITIPSKRPGQPPLKRITEVFDCWFESGSMPYAQSHYPFENKKEFEDAFPADFIAEGTDQTRGWFYTLLVLSTALFNRPPFKNLIVNGLVLASDGQKMSKRKKNYPDPMEILHKYGSDALRLYLINSPVVKAETLRFKEEGVRDILKDVFLPWFNAYRFLLQNVDNYCSMFGGNFVWDEATSQGTSTNVMDRWIISFTQSLLLFVNKEMAAYRLYTVLPRLMKFIDNLTNWYVRTNRKRLKGEGTSPDDCESALMTLFTVVYSMVRVFAPFTPFLAEQMYQKLRRFIRGQELESVHYVMIPSAQEQLIDERIEKAVSRMQLVVELGRILRDRNTMPVKYPLPELVVIHKDQECLDDVRELQGYVLDELNVKTLTLSTDKDAYGVVLRAEPDHKTLGFRLKGAFKDVMKEIKSLSDEKVTEFIRTGSLKILGHEIGQEDIRIMYGFDASKAKIGTNTYEAHSDNDLLVLLDCTPDQSMLDEGTARELVNRIQRLRKKAGLHVTDEVTVYYEVEPKDHELQRVITNHLEYLETSTKNPVRKGCSDFEKDFLESDSYNLKGATLRLGIVRGFCDDYVSASTGPKSKGFGEPWCKYVNVVCGQKVGAILIENPLDSGNTLSHPQFLEEVEDLFNCRIGQKPPVCLDTRKDLVEGSLAPFGGKTISATGPNSTVYDGCSCKFVNVECNGKRGTLLLENPAGAPVSDQSGETLAVMFGLKGNNVKVRTNDRDFGEVSKMSKEDWNTLAGKTVSVIM